MYQWLAYAGCDNIWLLINAISRTKSSKTKLFYEDIVLCLLQSNLSNPPTPPSSLPPTPPPSVQHKLLNGVTPGEELSEGQKDTEPAEEPMGKQ